MGATSKACLLAMRLKNKKEIRTHRKKIQERLPGKQQDGSFVYGFGNFRVEERVLPVLPRHGYCQSEKKKKIYISFLIIIQTLSKEAQEQFHRPCLPEEVLTVSALQPRTRNSLFHRKVNHKEGREQGTTPTTCCLKHISFLEVLFYKLLNSRRYVLLFPLAETPHNAACVSKIMHL